MDYLKRYYTGVGSRSTPSFVMSAMSDIAKLLSERGYILRSGAAQGADTAFERGADPHRVEIYLPWKGFNGSDSKLYGVCENAVALAKKIHPKKNGLVGAALKLHARNCYQVLGQDLKTPSDFLLAWTENAEKVGGTRTALILAENHNIPILNFGKCHSYDSCISKFELFFDMNFDFYG